VSDGHHGTCRECQANIYWIKTDRGKSHPCNDDLGQHSKPVFNDEGQYLGRGGMGRTSHFGTCPARKESSGASSSAPGDRQRQWELVCQAGAQTWSLEELRGLSTQLSRLVGIMNRVGAQTDAVETTRRIVAGIMKSGWGSQ
jgi:hypothetical protein